MSREAIIRRASHNTVHLNVSNNNAASIANDDINGLNFTGSFTLEGKWYPTNLAASSYIVSKYSFSDNNRQYALIYAASLNSITFNVSRNGTGSTLKQYRMIGDIELYRLYHIAVRYNANTEVVTFLLDGIEQPAVISINNAVGTPLEEGTADFCFGCLQNAGTYGTFMNGYLSDWRAWNVARTNEQINNNKHALADTDSVGLVGRWFHEKTDLSDESGNGNDLSAIGAPVVTAYGREASDRAESAADRISI